MFKQKIKEVIKKYNLLSKGERVVVGVSGGPDSVALLYLLHGLKKELKLHLHIAHLDHMLRKDSSWDRRFVENLAKSLGLGITCLQVNIKNLSPKGSIEEAARNARLGFFFFVAGEIKAKKIALGHNFDDQAETVLMRILRGAGLYGLTGILPKRNVGGYQIIRPLIEARRSEIEAFLKKKKLRFRRDSSNKENIYLRNRVRNKLLPLLEKEYNKNIRNVLANLAQSAGSDYDYLDKQARRFLFKNKSKAPLDKLLRLHPSMQRLIFRALFANLKGDTRRLTFGHIREIEDLAINRPNNSVVDLAGGISVIKKKNLLSFYRRNIK